MILIYEQLCPQKVLPMNNSITGKALVILIDNSPNSIDGDFYPNRLEAQKIAIERLSTYLFSICSYSQVALLTMSADEFGIRSSFTMSSSKINNVLRNIYSSSNLLNSECQNSLKKKLHESPDIFSDYPCSILLEKALKTALIMIDHFHYSNNIDNNDISLTNSIPPIEKQILVFICSKHDIKSDQVIEDIKKEALSKETIINFVAFGPDVNEKELLRKLVESENTSSTSNSQNSTNSSILNKSNVSNLNPANSPNSLNIKSSKKKIVNNTNKKNKGELHNPSKALNNANNNFTSPASGEFIDIPFPTNEILSDIVLSSRIGTGNVKPQIPVKGLLKTNPDLFEAVYEMLATYKRQAKNEIDTNIEHQIQVLENCSSSSKTPQRSIVKMQKAMNYPNSTILPLSNNNPLISDANKIDNDNSNTQSSNSSNDKTKEDNNDIN